MAIMSLVVLLSIRIPISLKTLLGDRALSHFLPAPKLYLLTLFKRNSDTDLHRHKSLHTSVVTGKKLTKLFYNKAHHKSYYLGCSLGGCQGIKSSEMFPDDFDAS